MRDAFAHLTTVGSGSYQADDVLFLLQPVEIEVTDVHEKERLIQTKQKHYSEMISQESAPTEVHKELYQRAMQQNAGRMASDVQSLALALDQACKGPSIALVSFVRAGVKVVNQYPDLKVKKVVSWPDSVGKWQTVDSYPDYKIQIVDSYPDFTIEYVESWPGVN